MVRVLVTLMMKMTNLLCDQQQEKNLMQKGVIKLLKTETFAPLDPPRPPPVVPTRRRKGPTAWQDPSGHTGTRSNKELARATRPLSICGENVPILQFDKTEARKISREWTSGRRIGRHLHPCKSNSLSEAISKLHQWMDTFQMNLKAICADMAFHQPHEKQAFNRMHHVKRFPRDRILHGQTELRWVYGCSRSFSLHLWIQLPRTWTRPLWHTSLLSS